jgi:hypothetical protein
VGFPSCNTELCRLPVNTADPHGYYAELGVAPWATDDEIRSAARRLYHRLHPDTGEQPDTARLQRIKLIVTVLTDPDQRARYNRTPPGKRLLDAVYRAELASLDVLSGLDAEQVRDVLRPTAVPSPFFATGAWYDYLAVDRQRGDMLLAQRWYAHLVGVAPLVGYRGRIRVMLHDGPAFFHPDLSTMSIPRSWVPSSASAFALFSAVAGMSRSTASSSGV